MNKSFYDYRYIRLIIILFSLMGSLLLFVKFLKVVFVNNGNLGWELMIFLIFIVLILVGLKFIKHNKVVGEKGKEMNAC